MTKEQEDNAHELGYTERMVGKWVRYTRYAQCGSERDRYLDFNIPSDDISVWNGKKWAKKALDTTSKKV